MAEVLYPIHLPAGPNGLEDFDVNIVVDDVAWRMIAVEGYNNTPDDMVVTVELTDGRSYTFNPPPGIQSRERIRLPPPRRLELPLITVPEYMDRGGVVHPEEQRRVLPFTRIVTERVFADPPRNSPVVLSVTDTQFNTSTTKNASLPATVNAGDGLLVLGGYSDNGGAGSSLLPSVGSGFTRVDGSDVIDGDYYDCLFVDIKVATGSEGGTTINLSGPSTAGAVHVFRIEAGSWGADPASVETSSMLDGASGTSANAPALTPSWGSADTLWFSYCLIEDNNVFSAGPAGYTLGGENQVNSTDDLAFGSVYRVNTTASEDPGSFTWSGSDPWAVQTVAVNPGGGSQEESGSGSIAATVTPTASGVKAGVGLGSLAGSATPSSSGVKAASASVSINATASPTSVGAKAAAVAALIEAVAAVTASGAQLEMHSGSGSISITSTVSSSGVKGGQFDALIQAVAALTGTGATARSVEASIPVSVTVTGAGATARAGSGTVSATITVSASGGNQVARIDLIVTLTASGAKGASGSPEIVAEGALLAFGAGGRSGSASISVTALPPVASGLNFRKRFTGGHGPMSYGRARMQPRRRMGFRR